MIKLKAIGCTIAAVAMAGCFTPQADAQQAPGTVADAMNRALFSQSGDIYRNAGIDRQATLLFGLSFPDHESLNDSKSVNNIYQDAIRQRNSAPVRTNDLPNPFNSSLLTNPPRN